MSRPAVALRLVAPRRIHPEGPCSGRAVRFIEHAERVDMLLSMVACNATCQVAQHRCESTDILERLEVLHGFNRAIIDAHHSCKGE